MQTSRSIEFRLAAEVNGQIFRMDGDGVGDPTDGSCTLRLEASPGFPDGFDPVSCPMICSHPTSVFFSRLESEAVGLAQVSGGAYDVAPARQGLVCGSGGLALLDLRVTSRMRLDGGRLVGDHVMQGSAHLPPLSHNVTPVEDHLLPAGPGTATGLARFGLVTRNGERLDGISTVPYAWRGPALPDALIRTVEHLDVEWDGHRRVVAQYRTALRPLKAVSDAAVLVSA